MSTSTIINTIQSVLNEYDSVHPKTDSHMAEIGNRIEKLNSTESSALYGTDLDIKAFLVEDYEIVLVVWIRSDYDKRFKSHLLKTTSAPVANTEDDFDRAAQLI